MKGIILAGGNGHASISIIQDDNLTKTAYEQYLQDLAKMQLQMKTIFNF